MRCALCFALLALSACTPDAEPPPEPSPAPPVTVSDDSIVGIVNANAQLTTVTQALESTGLGETLRDPVGAYTLFAPSDAAFAALPDAERTALLEDSEALLALLSAHTLSTRMLTTDIFDGLSIETLAGTEVALMSDGATVRIRDASGTTTTVTTADLDTSNGVVHIVDTVLTL